MRGPGGLRWGVGKGGMQGAAGEGVQAAGVVSGGRRLFVVRGAYSRTSATSGERFQKNLW